MCVVSESGGYRRGSKSARRVTKIPSNIKRKISGPGGGWAFPSAGRRRRGVDGRAIADAAEAAVRYRPRLARRAWQAARSMVRSGTKGRVPVGGKRAYSKKWSRIARNRPRISTLCEDAVLRHQGVNAELPNEDPDDTTYRYPGFYIIAKGDPTSAAASQVPLYYFDLTRLDNSGIATNCGGTFVTGATGGTDGTIATLEVGNQAASGVTSGSSQWRMERGSTISTTWNAKYVQNLWYDIRFKLYGCRRQTVTYDIILCRFKEDHLVPTAPYQPTDVKDLAERNNFYNQMARSAMVNTILPGMFEWTKRLKVLKRARHVIQPSLSTELDRNPDSVDFRWFVKDSKIYKHSQVALNLVTKQLNMTTTAWNVEQGTQYTNDPACQRSRLFLLVRATDMTAPVTGDDQDDTPSFDCVIRKRVRFFPPT